MTEPPSRLLRVLVPALLLLAAIGIGWAVMQNTSRPTQPAPPNSSTPAAPATTGAPSPPQADPPVAPAPAEPTTSGELPEGLLAGLRARPLTTEEAAVPLDPLGDPDDPSQPLRLEFSPYGAGLRSVTLSRYYQTLSHKPDNHVVVQKELENRDLIGPQGETRWLIATPFALAAAEVGGIRVPLAGISNVPGQSSADAPVWRQKSPGSFETVIVNEAGTELVRITRTFELRPGLHTIHLRQRVENLTDAALTVRLYQYGPADFDFEALGYGGDRRRVAFGYLVKPSMDPSRQLVLTDAYSLLFRPTIIGSKQGLVDAAGSPLLDGSRAQRTAFPNRTLWPRTTSTENEHELVWFGMANRYFAAVVFPLINPGAPTPPLPGPDKVLRGADEIYSVVLNGEAVLYERDAKMALQFRSPAYALAPGTGASVDVGVYAGPLDHDAIEADPSGAALGLTGLPVYNLGGPCAPCTFEWLTGLLLGLLHTLHHYLLRDWALSIIVLVVIVRTILHPVTKWSQIRITRFGKQMQELAPKQKKLQEKYKDDPKKLREETGKLWREEGVSPAGMLGCVPAFLQTPIWIAMYAVLFFDFDLRHHGAFFGLFQAISGGSWWFLGDLSSPDHFIGFGTTFNIPLLGSLIGPVDGLNVLPIILGFVFFVQQKYLTPPTSAQLTPEQEQTQKITKIMMVVMFPVLMYNAPSGLALYFLTNSSLGILESKYIRSHIDKYDLGKPTPRGPGGAGGPSTPHGPKKPGGFMARLQARLEERQRQLARQRQGQAKRRG